MSFGALNRLISQQCLRITTRPHTTTYNTLHHPVNNHLSPNISSGISHTISISLRSTSSSRSIYTQSIPVYHHQPQYSRNTRCSLPRSCSPRRGFSSDRQQPSPLKPENADQQTHTPPTPTQTSTAAPVSDHPSPPQHRTPRVGVSRDRAYVPRKARVSRLFSPLTSAIKNIFQRPAKPLPSSSPGQNIAQNTPATHPLPHSTGPKPPHTSLDPAISATQSAGGALHQAKGPSPPQQQSPFSIPPEHIIDKLQRIDGMKKFSPMERLSEEQRRIYQHEANKIITQKRQELIQRVMKNLAIICGSFTIGFGVFVLYTYLTTPPEVIPPQPSSLSHTPIHQEDHGAKKKPHSNSPEVYVAKIDSDIDIHPPSEQVSRYLKCIRDNMDIILQSCSDYDIYQSKVRKRYYSITLPHLRNKRLLLKDDYPALQKFIESLNSLEEVVERPTKVISRSRLIVKESKQLLETFSDILEENEQGMLTDDEATEVAASLSVLYHRLIDTLYQLEESCGATQSLGDVLPGVMDDIIEYNEHAIRKTYYFHDDYYFYHYSPTIEYSDVKEHYIGVVRPFVQRLRHLQRKNMLVSDI